MSSTSSSSSSSSPSSSSSSSSSSSADHSCHDILLHDPLHRAEDLGKPLPHSPHACSVCLPTWRHVVGYEEGDPAVHSVLTAGYPRFVLHPYVARLQTAVLERFAESPDELCYVFPTRDAAERCRTLLHAKGGYGTSAHIHVITSSTLFSPRTAVADASSTASISINVNTAIANASNSTVVPSTTSPTSISPTAYAVLFHKDVRPIARLYWQHFGDVVSSRFAWDLLNHQQTHDAHLARVAVRERIAACMGESRDHVFLYPSGMSAISHSLQLVQALRPNLPSVQFGFPYLDTYKIQTALGPGCVFYARADDADLRDLEERLANGARFSAVLLEFPGNPLLSLPNLPRLSRALRAAQVPLIVDDTVASFANVSIMEYADVVTSSLTKWFSGTGDVMAGALTLNVRSPFFTSMQRWMRAQHADALYSEDVVALEKNSRDFMQRIERVNATTERVIAWLQQQPEIESIYSPLVAETQWGDNVVPATLPAPKANANAIAAANAEVSAAAAATAVALRSPHPSLSLARTRPGFGGVFSIVLRNAAQTSARFFDALSFSKGPSLGNNFTLVCPYTLLAHYTELDWTESVGVSRYLLRFSLGLEDADEICRRLRTALDVVSDASTAANPDASSLKSSSGSISASTGSGSGSSSSPIHAAAASVSNSNSSSSAPAAAVIDVMAAA